MSEFTDVDLREIERDRDLPPDEPYEHGEPEEEEDEDDQ